MAVIGSRHENHIQFLAVVLEDLPPIGIPGRLFPAFLAQDATPPGLVHFRKSDALQAGLVAEVRMGLCPPLGGNESHLELFIEPLGPDEARETHRAGGADGHSTLDKLTTRNVRHEPGSFLCKFQV